MLKDQLHDLELIFSVELDMMTKQSTNKIYSGVHYTKRRQHKDMFRYEVYRVIREFDLKEIKEYPIALMFQFEFKSHVLDSSNCSYMAKIIEDWFVKFNIIQDDIYKCIKFVIYSSIKSKRNKITMEAYKI